MVYVVDTYTGGNNEKEWIHEGDKGWRDENFRIWHALEGGPNDVIWHTQTHTRSNK